MISYVVRKAANDDSSQIASLLTALGHDTSSERVNAMWQDWTLARNCAFVAVIPTGELIGLVTLHQMAVLHRPLLVGRITALYVTENSRNCGIGRALVNTAEADLKSSGCGLIEITSNFRLTEAHAFYEHLGYTKTSVRLAKEIADPKLQSSTQGFGLGTCYRVVRRRR